MCECVWFSAGCAIVLLPCVTWALDAGMDGFSLPGILDERSEKFLDQPAVKCRVGGVMEPGGRFLGCR